MTMREEFEAWCKINCSPGGETSDWYYRIWKSAYRAGQEEMRERIDAPLNRMCVAATNADWTKFYAALEEIRALPVDA